MKNYSSRLNVIIKLKVIFASLLFIGLTSCKDHKDEVDNPTPSVPEAVGSIRLALDYLDVTYEMTEETITFEADHPWRIETAPDWINVAPAKGDKGKDISLTVNIAENPEYEERSGQLIISSVEDEGSDTLTIRQFAISAYVPVDYETNRLTEFNPATGLVRLTCNGRKPALREGVSIVVPTDSIDFIRIVKHINEDGNTLTLQTEEGDMTDLFVNQEFTLSTAPATRAMVTRTGRIQTTDERGVIHPYKITSILPDGTVHTLYDLQTESRQVHSKGIVEGGGTNPLFSYPIKRDGDTIQHWTHADLIYEKCRFEPKLDGEFYFRFGADAQIEEDKPIKIPKGELLNFWFLLDGQVTADAAVKLIARKEYSDGIVRPVLQDVLGLRGMTFRFFIGGIPVSVNVNADVYFEASMAAEAEAELTAGVTAAADIQAGFGYVYGSRSLEPIFDRPDFNLSYSGPELTVKGSVETQVSVYPDLRIRFFNFAGPNIQIKPYLIDRLEADGQLGGGNTHAGWQNTLSTQVQMKGQLCLDFIGEEEWKSDDLPLELMAQTVLHRTPDKIEVVSPADGIEVDNDEPITVSVKVTDYSHDGKKPESKEAMVKFDPSRGRVDADYVTTNEKGEAKSTWFIDASEFRQAQTRGSGGYELNVNVMGKDEEIISQATFTPTVRNRDREILEAFYHSANGKNWPRQDNWCTDAPLNEWYGIDTNQEGRVTRISLDGMETDEYILGTADFRGLDMLEYLYLGGNITSLNLADCVSLKVLYASYIGLSELNVAGCSALEYMSIEENELSQLDILDCVNLTNLRAFGNQLTHLDLSANKKLQDLYCSSNRLSTLNVSGLNELRFLGVGNEGFGEIVGLQQLNGLTSLHITESSYTTLDLSYHPHLKNLYIGKCPLTVLDVSTNTDLIALTISGTTTLQEINISDMPLLETFETAFNEQLQSITVTNCPLLNEVQLYLDNKISKVNLSNNPRLDDIYIYDDYTLNELNVSGCTSLKTIAPGYAHNLNLTGCTAFSLRYISGATYETIHITGCPFSLPTPRIHAKVVYLSAEQHRLAEDIFELEGEVDYDKYRSPEHIRGRQYPRFVIE